MKPQTKRPIHIITLGVVAALITYQDRASALTFTLENVKFGDGAIASGTFDYDTDTQTYSNPNILTSNGVIQGTTYTPYGTKIQNTSPTGLALQSVYNSQTLTFAFNQPLQSGTTSITDFGTSKEQTMQPDFTNGGVKPLYQRNITVGDVISSAQSVPFDFNPTQGAILGVPLFLGMRWFKKKIKQKGRISIPSKTFA